MTQGVTDTAYFCYSTAPADFALTAIAGREFCERIMIDEGLAGLRLHRENIDRYRRLLRTNLTALEQDFIERRIAEEQLALNRLAGETFPIVMTLSDAPRAA